jgi:two-component system cell cycle sensor histidine kinase/response regulator CckA
MPKPLTLTFSSRSYATRVALSFIVWSALWIISSDYLVKLITPDHEVLWTLQTEKGLLYVTISGVLLWLAIQSLERDEATRRAANEHRLRLLKESGLIGVAGWKADGTLSYGNEAFFELLGFREEELLGKFGHDLVPPDCMDVVFQSDQELMEQGRSELYRCDLLRKDGTRVPVIGGRALVDSSQESISYFVNISRLLESEAERLRLQEQLLHSEKVNALGQFAGGVAHNFNNELSIMVGYCTLVNDQLEAGSSGRRNLNLVLAAIERARRLIQQLLAFSRKQKVHMEKVDLNDVVHEFEPVFRQLLSNAIDINVSLSKENEFVELDRTQFEQVLLNLVGNARDAMPRGGRLRINVGHEDARQNAAPHCGEAHVTVKVADNGIGMDEATKARIFEPFFTTKGVRGTGLGLATAFGVVAQSKGDISVESGLGLGTTFILRFPKLADVPPKPEPKSHLVRVRAAKASILLVEDNHDLRFLLKQLLELEGMAVIAARDGVEAVEFASLPALPFDLIVSDVVMPRLNGPDAVKQIRKLRPQIKVIFVSGSADQIDADVRDTVLWKPVTPQVLLEAVHTCLGEPVTPERDDSRVA